MSTIKQTKSGNFVCPKCDDLLEQSQGSEYVCQNCDSVFNIICKYPGIPDIAAGIDPTKAQYVSFPADSARVDDHQVSKGFDRGNYAAAYETANYSEAMSELSGATGFYRIGHMLGFFSIYELHEIPEEFRSHVEKYRELSQKNGWNV